MLKNRFEQRLNSLSSELWIKIAQIDELKGQWIAGIHLSTQVLGRLKRSILITSTGASTRIEGARLSDEDIEKLMRGLDIQKFTDRDKQEVKGYFELLENVFNAWKTIKLSESIIKHFHKELLKYVQKDKVHRGEYKKNENKVHMIDKEGQSIGVLFDTTQAFLTPKEMQELVKWAQSALLEKKNHPLLIIANFIVEFLQIHPFQDGNGRLSRILTNLLLLKTGYLYMPYVSHEKLIEDNKPDYYMALRKSQKTLKTSHETITPWLDFFLEILLQQSKIAIELLSQENIEKILSVKQLAVWQYIQTVNEATPKEIMQKTKIVRPTVNQILDKLIRLKKIERLGLGRSTRYRKL
ncbi:MAG: Adenosine monophosphate-protein transferase SoFic [Candidatus Anoxychlamydiales bacterium]|nr:Adenosine monophosphate-protein transferase SoFic [Candidatus Anoxychlamydiales bacterium]